MVASRVSPRLVPFELLLGASCLLPERPMAGFRVSDRGHPGAAPSLTPAEQRVLGLVLDGLANKEIADRLGRAEPTIKNQVAAILRKHRVPSRARLLALLRG